MIAFARPWMLLGLLSIPLAVFLVRGCRGKGLILGFRIAALTAAVLAAAGVRITAPTDRVSTVFVLDVSDSIGRQGISHGMNLINDMLKSMEGDDEAALITTAANAAVETPLRPGGSTFDRSLMHNGDRTNLAAGIYSATALLSGAGPDRRIVLLSDGRENTGRAEAAAALAAQNGITLEGVAIGGDESSEVLVRDLRVSGNLDEGEVHALTAVFQTAEPVSGRLLILLNGELIGEDRLSLSDGLQRRRYEMPGLPKGRHVYEVLLDVPTDGIPENNRGLAVTRVEGSPRTLWVGVGESAVPQALEVQGHIVERRAPWDLPAETSGYEAYDTVILDNVSARELSMRSMDLLETWVRVRGGGLMMVGGDASFGLGGWQDTPVELALPVSMDAPSSLYIPSLTMVMVVDKSGSMGSPAGGNLSKLDIVKEAVLQAFGMLNPLYSVGLVAFDADTEWTIPITGAGNLGEIKRGLAGLDSGGGTNLYPAIREAYAELIGSPSAVRHLLVLSDGLGESANYDELARAVARDGITMSTVAVGNDADISVMEDLAELGGGRYWYAEDATQIPRIFASESMIVSHGLTVDETIFPQPVVPTKALDGLDLSVLPPLHGYVMAYPDAVAVEALRSPRGHPLLTYGHHGLGRTMAFTSDLRGSWGRDWSAWNELPRFLSQSVRWLSAGAGSGNEALMLRSIDGRVSITFEAGTSAGGFRSNLEPMASVITPDQRELPVSLVLTAPGRYEGSFLPSEPGVYSCNVIDEKAGISLESSWTRAYSPELTNMGTDVSALASICIAGGGRLVNPQLMDAEAWWRIRTPAKRTVLDLTRLLALASLVFFLIDIGLRESAGWKRESTEAAAGSGMSLETLVLNGLKADGLKSGYRRRSPAEAARLLAEKRQSREKNRNAKREK